MELAWQKHGILVRGRALVFFFWLLYSFAILRQLLSFILTVSYSSSKPSLEPQLLHFHDVCTKARPQLGSSLPKSMVMSFEPYEVSLHFSRILYAPVPTVARLVYASAHSKSQLL